MMQQKLLRAIALTSLAVTTLLASPSSSQERAMQEDEGQEVEHRVMIWKDEGEGLFEMTSSGRGFLGVSLLDMTPELRTYFQVPESRGVLVSRVLDESPALDAGIAVGDVITDLSGAPIRNVLQIQIELARKPGEVVNLYTYRAGEPRRVEATLVEGGRQEVDLSSIVIRSDGTLPHLFEGAGDRKVKVRREWVERTAKDAARQLSEPRVQVQLEAMRRERAELLDRLELMESQLRALRTELEMLSKER